LQRNAADGLFTRPSLVGCYQTLITLLNYEISLHTLTFGVLLLVILTPGFGDFWLPVINQPYPACQGGNNRGW